MIRFNVLAAAFFAALIPSIANAQDVSATANSVYRDFFTPGNAASGAYNPPKADIRSLWASQKATNDAKVNKSGDTMTGDLTLAHSSFPKFVMSGTSNATDSKTVQSYVSTDGSFHLEFLNDSGSSSIPFLTVTRSGTMPTGFVIGAPTFAPSLTINAPTGLNSSFSTTQTFSGTSTAGFTAPNYFLINGDTADVGSTAFLQAWTWEHDFGGSTVRGGREGGVFFLRQTAATSPVNGNFNYTPLVTIMQTNSGDGGTGTSSSTARGAYIGGNPNTVLGPLAANAYDATGTEINVALQTDGTHTASSRLKYLLRLAGRGDDAAHGSYQEAMLAFAIQGVAGCSTIGISCSIQWNNGILFTDQGIGKFPLSSSATMLGATAGAIANGVDLTALTISGSAFKSPGFNVSGSGAITASLPTSGTATGTVCAAAGGVLFVKTTAGACL